MHLPNDTELKKREMEKAIAASLIAAYCTFVLLIIFKLPNFTNDKQFELATTAIIDFSWIIGVIIVFYFSSRSFDKWVDYKKEIDSKNKSGEGAKSKEEQDRESNESVNPQIPSKTEDTIPVGQENVQNETSDILKMEYKEVHSYWRTLTDIRFKLLAFVPTLAGLGVAFIPKTTQPLEAFAVGLLGFIVTLGITFYDQRNSQLYDAAIERARDLEREMKFRSPDEKEFGGIFYLRPGRTRKFFGIKMWHDRALAMVYASAIGAWLFIIINSISQLIFWPFDVYIKSGTFSLLLSVFLAIVIYKILPKP